MCVFEIVFFFVFLVLGGGKCGKGGLSTKGARAPFPVKMRQDIRWSNLKTVKGALVEHYG